MRVLSVAAHLDDNQIGCEGILSQLVVRGDELKALYTSGYERESIPSSLKVLGISDFEVLGLKFEIDRSIPANITNLITGEVSISKVTTRFLNFTARDSTFWSTPTDPVTMYPDIGLEVGETVRKAFNHHVTWNKDPSEVGVEYVLHLEPSGEDMTVTANVALPSVYLSEVEFVPKQGEIRRTGETITIAFQLEIVNDGPLETIHTSEVGYHVLRVTAKDGSVASDVMRKVEPVELASKRGEPATVNTSLVIETGGKDLPQVVVEFQCYIDEAKGSLVTSVSVDF